MKIKSTLLLMACFTMLTSFGQKDLTLKLVKDTDQPVSVTEHFYLFEVTNNSNEYKTFDLNAINTSCAFKNKSSQVNLNHAFYNVNKQSIGDQITLDSGTSANIYLKISRPKNVKLNTWNCTAVSVTRSNTSVTSNTVIIKTLVPDPKDFN